MAQFAQIGGAQQMPASVQNKLSAFESILGSTDKTLPTSLARASAETTDKKILADLWSAWDGWNWESSELMKSDLSTRLDEFLDFFPIVDKDVAINQMNIKFAGDSAWFDEWDFPTFVIEDMSRRTAPRMNTSTRNQRTQTMSFKSNGFEMPMDFVTDPSKLAVFIKEMQRLNDNIKQTWAYRILETVYIEAAVAFYKRIADSLPYDHDKFMEEIDFAKDMLLAIQKSGTRMLGIETKKVPQMRNNSVEPDAVINTAGALRHAIIVNELQNVVSEVGANALVQNKNLEMDIPQPATGARVVVARTEKYGLRYHETRVFDLSDNEEPSDPSVYPLNLSLAFRMEPNDRMDIRDYSSDSRTITVVNGEKGREEDLTLLKAFLHCGMFHTKNNANSQDVTEFTPEGREIAITLCSARVSREEQFAGTISGNNGLPLDEDDDFDVNSRDVQPPFFGDVAAARAHKSVLKQDEIMWDKLKRSVNAYTMFKRAGGTLLKDVVELLCKLPDNKYEEFLRVKKRQEAIAADPYNYTPTTSALSGSLFQMGGRNWGSGMSGKSSSTSSTNNSSDPFNSLFGGGAAGSRGGNGTLPKASPFGVGNVVPVPLSNVSFVTTSGVNNIASLPRSEYQWIKRQFATLITPLDDAKSKAHRMLDPETGLQSVSSDDVFRTWSLLLEDISSYLADHGALDDVAVATITKFVDGANVRSGSRLSQATSGLAGSADLYQLVCFNVLHLLVSRLKNATNDVSLRTQVRNWYDFVAIASSGGQSKLANIKRNFQNTIQNEQLNGKNPKTLIVLLTDTKALLENLQMGAVALPQLPGIIANINAHEADIENANAQTPAAGGGGGGAKIQDPENRTIAIFLRGDPKTLGPFANVDDDDWNLARAICEEAITESDSYSAFDKLVLQQFILLLLTEAVPTNAVVKDIKATAGGAAGGILKPADYMIEILRDGEVMLGPDPYYKWQNLASKNRQDGAGKARARRLDAISKKGGRSRQRLESDSDSDSDAAPARRSKGGRSSKKRSKAAPCEPENCRDIAEVLQLLYNMRLSKDFFIALISNNIPVPISFDILQMWIRLMAGSTVFLKKGITTGVMVINEAAMMFSRNPETFTVRVFARFACGTFIRATKNLEFVPHTYCTGYKGGAGLRWFDYSLHLQNFQMGGYPFDIIPIANPYYYKPTTNLFEITGSMHKDLYSGGEVGQWHYPTANAYTRMLHLTRQQQRFPHIFSRNYFIEGNPRNSTIAIKSSQKEWEPSGTLGRGTITKLVPGRSALGDEVQPKDFDVLRGTSEFIGRGIEGSASRVAYRGR